MTVTSASVSAPPKSAKPTSGIDPTTTAASSPAKSGETTSCSAFGYTAAASASAK
jgi:hypothetical protein